MNSKFKKTGALVLLGTICAVVATSQTYIIYTGFNQPFDLTRLFLAQFTRWQAWICAIPLIIWISRIFHLEDKSWHRWLAVHLPASILLGAIQIAIVAFTNIIVFPWTERLQNLSFLQYYRSLSYSFHFEILIYLAILGSVSILRTSRLEAQLAQANLQTLKMQLHPHFLFNTLNSIVSLIRNNENKAAVNMVVGVSDLLRQVLDNDRRQEVKLKEELEFIELYLEIQQMRFSDRLQVKFAIDPTSLDVLVPNLILQPIVENAIKYGINISQAAGRVEMAAQREGEMLRLRIFNEGSHLDEDWSSTENNGLGIANTKARLEQLYRVCQSFQMENVEGGVAVNISLPWRVATEK